MTKIIDFMKYKKEEAGKRGFNAWAERFGEIFGTEARIADISPKTLYCLASPGDDTVGCFYELILGALDMGRIPGFDYLEKKEQLKVMDIHFFLADQTRFELMKRLGWVTSYPGEKFTIIEMIVSFARVRKICADSPPILSKDHPYYERYSNLTSGDKEVMVRRMLVEALDEFSSHHLDGS